MTAAELFEIVKGTHKVWHGDLYCTKPEIAWLVPVEVGHAHRSLEKIHPTRAEKMILGCMVQWLGERGCDFWQDKHNGETEHKVSMEDDYGVNTIGTGPTQLHACAEAVRVLLREEAGDA